MEKKTRGRQKIEIKRIDDNISRQITLSKRKRGLFTQAEQLAIRCRAEIAVIIFSGVGKLYTYTNTTMDSVLSRYNKRSKVRNQTGQPKLNQADQSKATFLKRRLRLFKMAEHLSILCSSEIAIIIFPNRGELIEYANTTMDSVLSIYNENKSKVQNQKDHSNPNQSDESEICHLKSEVTKLRLSLRQMAEKEDIECLSLPELERLEDEINERLLGIKNKKERMENSKSRKRKKPRKECNDSTSTSIPVLITFE